MLINNTVNAPSGSETHSHVRVTSQSYTITSYHLGKQFTQTGVADVNNTWLEVAGGGANISVSTTTTTC